MVYTASWSAREISNDCFESIPLQFQSGHELIEPFVFSNIVQVWIDLKITVIWKARLCGGLQPLNSVIRIIQCGIGGRDVVSSVMEMSVAASDLNRALNRFLRLFLFP